MNYGGACSSPDGGAAAPDAQEGSDPWTVVLMALGAALLLCFLVGGLGGGGESADGAKDTPLRERLGGLPYGETLANKLGLWMKPGHRHSFLIGGKFSEPSVLGARDAVVGDITRRLQKRAQCSSLEKWRIVVTEEELLRQDLEKVEDLRATVQRAAAECGEVLVLVHGAHRATAQHLQWFEALMDTNGGLNDESSCFVFLADTSARDEAAWAGCDQGKPKKRFSCAVERMQGWWMEERAGKVGKSRVAFRGRVGMWVPLDP